MAVPMNSNQFRATVAPILNETFDGLYEQRADEWKQVFKEFTGIARAYHEVPDRLAAECTESLESTLSVCRAARSDSLSETD